ncbi:MAG: glycoside hydrolase family 32 protein [Lachnospiraceae bacterium]|nr:glycoside hydrolase family 32 protein [Lachnospiraceae bacterium]
MSETKLEKARAYEEAAGSTVPADLRPRYHLSSRCGWMNDPNGFSFYGGKYHMFYQYYPYENKWGPMHWAHAASADLLHWEYLPAILAPEEFYDSFGCFSGSCETLPDGRHFALYTGVANDPSDFGPAGLQTQNIAVGDGVNYVKYEGNPVITPAMLPEGSSFIDFRDPKVWKCKDGSMRCVIAAMDKNGYGMIVLFSSEDGFKWKFEDVLAHDPEPAMWECPDMFELDGTGLFLTSQLRVFLQGSVREKDCRTMYFVGETGDEMSYFKFDETSARPIDLGLDFYAPQTMVTPDGRRIMIGWMQNWESLGNRLPGLPWYGQMTAPREIHVRDGNLIQNPARELLALRGEKTEHRDVEISGKAKLEGLDGRFADIELTLREIPGKNLDRFRMNLLDDGKNRVSVIFTPSENKMVVERVFPEFGKTKITQRKGTVAMKDGKLDLRILLDRFSAEVFANNGEAVFTTCMYTESGDGVSFKVDGSCCVDVVKYDMK